MDEWGLVVDAAGSSRAVTEHAHLLLDYLFGSLLSAAACALSLLALAAFYY